jgi:hypothetical protein
MIRSTVTVLVWLSIGVSSGCATKTPDHKGFSRFDLNNDGYLTPEEYSASELSKALAFAELDTDEDGLLSNDELSFRLDGARSAGSEGKGGRSGRGGRNRT